MPMTKCGVNKWQYFAAFRAPTGSPSADPGMPRTLPRFFPLSPRWVEDRIKDRIINIPPDSRGPRRLPPGGTDEPLSRRHGGWPKFFS